jgi:hypothetical protein
MPVSKRDKKRKEKVLKYKKSKKMSETKPEQMKPFRQIPTWQRDEEFTIQGHELEALYNFFNVFAPSFTAVQQVFARGVQAGKIKTVFEYEDGTLVPDKEVEAYTKKLNTYFKERMKQQGIDENADVETADIPADNDNSLGGKVLNMHGVEATPDNVG